MAKCKVGRCTPQQAAQAWNTGFSAGAETARQTVNAGNVQWAAPTAAAEPQIAMGISQAFTSGRWLRGVQRTGDAGWKAGMLTKGIPHMAAGSQAGGQHYGAFRAQWDPFVQSIKASLPPRGSFEQNKARSMSVQDQFHAAKGRFKGLWKGQGG